jgi:dolichyl-diphosphooligosaccharide--protein glycosyltransferase
LNSQTKLFQAGSFNVRLNHLVIIGVLVLAFSLSFLIRSQPADYGYELMEFDPFFNFRATEYVVENGFTEYFQWHDTKSWYLPEDSPGISGRNVSATSQVMLHTTAAITYQIFGGNSSLYDFTILFPAVIGSLTVIVIFGLVRVFAGTTAGLFASLLFAISLPILLRGTIGWFKSEPLGIFYALLGLYFFFSGIRSKNKKIAFSKIILGGFIMTFAMASWGGIQFFIIPVGLFILALPFVRKDHKFLIWSIPLFVGVFLLSALMFERPGIRFVFGLGGISLIIPTIFLVLCIFIQKISIDKNKIRNGIILLISVIIIGSSLLVTNEESNLLQCHVDGYDWINNQCIIPTDIDNFENLTEQEIDDVANQCASIDNAQWNIDQELCIIEYSQLLPLPSFRYLNALNPFLTTIDPLTDSVSEHSTTSIQLSFLFHSIFLIFSALGAWFLLSKKIFSSIIFERNEMRVFVLIMGITGVYVSSAFVRLEIFASIALIFLTSIGLSILIKEIFKINLSKKKNYSLKISSIAIIFILFTIPLVYPTTGNWISSIDFPATILNGGTSYPPSNDWIETLEWIKVNTAEDSVVASWWDYGYWISTVAERTTLIDNATISSWQIAKVAEIFMSTPDEAWNLLTAWDVDYVVVYVAAQRLDGDWNGDSLYVLNGGGDESKKSWFMRIANVDYSKYTEFDGLTGNNYFWNETLLGKMIPYNTLLYYNEASQESSTIFQNGFVPISVLDINYLDDGNYPFKLVHTSPSFTNKNIDRFSAVLVYEINKNYISIDDDLMLNQNMNLEN